MTFLSQDTHTHKPLITVAAIAEATDTQVSGGTELCFLCRPSQTVQILLPVHILPCACITRIAFSKIIQLN